jgi:hypothetical protein
VVSLAVLGDDDPDWRPDHYRHGRWGSHSGIQFPPTKLLDYAPHWQALEADPNPFAMVVLAHLKTRETRQDPGERRAWKTRLVKGLYDRGMAEEDVRQLFRFIDWLMDLPEPLEILFRQEMIQFEEEKRMPYITSVERMAAKQELLAGIEVALKLKFGPAGTQLLPEIRQIADLEVLRAVLRGIEPAASLDDLRQVWAKQS